MQTRSAKYKETSVIKASIIVPTYKEYNNIEPLVSRVFAALEKQDMASTTEMIIVDDNSRDGTEELVNNNLCKKYNVRLSVRTKERGLSSAVLHGFQLATGSLLFCMDADLQHPPEMLPDMITSLDKQDVEFVIGTRYKSEDGIDKSWPFYRRVISWGGQVLVMPLTSLSDPMTGFFGVKRNILERNLCKINAVGFKIALEIYVKSNVKKHAEVPIIFGVRVSGESKLSGKIIFQYAGQLISLYNYLYPLLVPSLIVLVTLLFSVLYFLFVDRDMLSKFKVV